MRLLVKDAELIVSRWIREERAKQIKKMKPPGPKPEVYRFVSKPSVGKSPETIKNDLGPDLAKVLENELDAPEIAFFVDLLPGANWEHLCQYVIVHSSKRLSILNSTAPPNPTLNGALKKVKGIFPHDNT